MRNLNALQAPWYQSEPPGRTDLETTASFLSNYGDNFISVASANEIIPLFHQDILRVLYIPRRRVSAAASRAARPLLQARLRHPGLQRHRAA